MFTNVQTPRTSVHNVLMMNPQSIPDLFGHTDEIDSGSAAPKRIEVRRPWLLKQVRERAVDLAATEQRRNEALAVVAHELRNALGVVRNATQFIEMGLHEPQKVEKAVAIIERQIGQMARLTNDLLEVSQIATGRFNLRRERIDLCVLAKEAAESVELEIARRNQRFAVTLSEAPVWLRADRGRLLQVLVNLLCNAIKYTDNGGEVALFVECTNQWATVRVRDSGIGIAAEVLPHVFEPFVQAQSSLSRSEKGLGIGLALVRSLVESHQGHVIATSAGLGQGSEFTVHLPAIAL